MCKKYTHAKNIVDLIDNHTDENGFFICEHCKNSNDTYIYKESDIQERDDSWERWLRGIIKIDSGVKTYSPYVFFIDDTKKDKPEEFRFQFQYYKDTRSDGGKIKHGHGPGGGPVLEIENLLYIIKHLIKIGSLSVKDIKTFIQSIESE